MAARTALNRRTWPLIAVCIVVAGVVILLATLERFSSDPTRATASFTGTVAPPGAEPVRPSETSTAVSPISSAEDPAPSSGIVEGFVLDARTGLGVPWIDVQIEGSGSTDPCVVRTRRDGRFSTRGKSTFANGDVTARVRDGDVVLSTEIAKHRADVGTHEWKIAVPIGPMVLLPNLSRRSPSSVRDWDAMITESVYPLGSAGEIDVRGDALSIAGDTALRCWSRQPVRFVEDAPFVRWPRLEIDPDPRLTARLTVRSRVHGVYGSTALRGTVGEQESTIDALQSLQFVQGKLELPAGLPRFREVRIVAWTRGASDATRSTPTDVVEVTPVGGAFQFDVRLSRPEESFELAAFAEGCNAVVTTVTSHAEDVAQPALKLSAHQGRPASYDKGWGEFLKDSDSGIQMIRTRMSDPSVPTCAWTIGSSVSGWMVDSIPVWRHQMEIVAVDQDPMWGGGSWTQTMPDRLERTPQTGEVTR